MVQVTREFVHHCLPVRKRDGHKGTFGKVHILAGSVGLTGAAALTAAAAVRTGSGLVSLSVPPEIWPFSCGPISWRWTAVPVPWM